MTCVSWDTICKPKSLGGLGFKDLAISNKELLEEQGWRILQFPNSLLAQVLKAMYFKNTYFFSANLGGSPSYVWSSIIFGRQLLCKGIRWRDGNGRKIRVIQIRGFLRMIILNLLPYYFSESLDVANFIKEGQWRKELLEILFCEQN